MAVALYEKALGEQSDRIRIQSGYTLETAHKRGYSDHTAVRLTLHEGGELHVLKEGGVCKGDPCKGESEHVPEIRGAEAIRQAFGSDGYAYGVLQLDAVEELLQSGRATTVRVYNPATSNIVTHVHFNSALAIAA